MMMVTMTMMMMILITMMTTFDDNDHDENKEDDVEHLLRHEVTQGGHGGGWNESTSIDKVSSSSSFQILSQNTRKNTKKQLSGDCNLSKQNTKIQNTKNRGLRIMRARFRLNTQQPGEGPRSGESRLILMILMIMMILITIIMLGPRSGGS